MQMHFLAHTFSFWVYRWLRSFDGCDFTEVASCAQKDLPPYVLRFKRTLTHS